MRPRDLEAGLSTWRLSGNDGAGSRLSRRVLQLARQSVYISLSKGETVLLLDVYDFASFERESDLPEVVLGAEKTDEAVDLSVIIVITRESTPIGRSRQLF